MSTNISKQKRDDLLNKIKQIKAYIESSPQDENTKNLLAYLGELTKEVNGKKYGLVFEEHREAIDEILEKNAPVLTEEEDLFINNGGEMNFLIEGDNLAALKLLEKTHKGKIDVIYIDPPYNTGNKDFIYDDCYVDSNDEFKHSKWLSFMEKRLRMARLLLSEDGMIFISIDDHENNGLKLLCDEVFSASNFVTSIPRITKAQRAGQENYMDISHDYIICYAFADDFANIIDRNYSETEILQDKNGKYIKGDTKAILAAKSQGYSKGGDYDFIYNGKTYSPVDKDGVRNRWLWTKQRMEAAAELGILVETGNTLRMQLYIDKKFEEKTNKLIPKDEKLIFHTSDFMTNTSYTNSKGVSDFDNISKEISRKFTNPKPIELIKKLCLFCPNHNANILDFFAGSGTTGQAIMQLNAEDGGHRKFILCTNNQNCICRDITYERQRLVIEQNNYPASLKYYKIDYIPIEEKMYYEYADELLEHVRELVELENAIDFNTNQTVAIVLDDEELEDFVDNIEEHKECKILYKGHDVLSSFKQEQILKAHGISVNVVPDYYYRDLAD